MNIRHDRQAPVTSSLVYGATDAARTLSDDIAHCKFVAEQGGTNFCGYDAKILRESERPKKKWREIRKVC